MLLGWENDTCESRPSRRMSQPEHTRRAREAVLECDANDDCEAPRGTAYGRGWRSDRVMATGSHNHASDWMPASPMKRSNSAMEFRSLVWATAILRRRPHKSITHRAANGLFLLRHQRSAAKWFSCLEIAPALCSVELPRIAAFARCPRWRARLKCGRTTAVSDR